MKIVDAGAIHEMTFPVNMGEVTDFERIFLLYHAPLRFYCEEITRAGDECEDIVSHLFSTLWQKQVTFESTEHAQAYLYRSAKNACLNFLRNEKRADQKKELWESESPQMTDSYLDAFIKTESFGELYRAIESLPPQCCKVITMGYLEGLTNQEIANEMGLSVKTVKNHKLRGLGLLKAKLPDGLFALLLGISMMK